MPEIKNQFTGGKMNKDLDERLIPKGEYRDAMNIQVSTSEGSDVGAVQNILGNLDIQLPASLLEHGLECVGSISDEKTDSSYWFLRGADISYSPESAGTYSRDYIIRLKSGVVDIIFTDTKEIITFAEAPVGNPLINISLDIANDIIYLPVGGAVGLSIGDTLLSIGGDLRNKSTITGIHLSTGSTDLEFIVLSKLIPPNLTMPYDGSYKLVFKSNCLNFQPNNNITGINIIDDLLFWTDNYNEPKMLNIERSKQGTDQTGVFHTYLINPQLPSLSTTKKVQPHHIQVIKRKPVRKIGVEIVDGRRPGIIYSDGGYRFSSTIGIAYSQGYEGKAINGTHLTVDSGIPGSVVNYEVGDILLLLNTTSLTSGSKVLPQQYDVKIVAKSISHDIAAGTTGLDFEIISIAADTPLVMADYTVVTYQETSNLFEEEMFRFSYRYKFLDGEVSSFAPFSELIFLPGEFRYDNKNAYNFGMLNNAFDINLINFIDFENTLNVSAIDLLVKNENSPLVYLIDTIKRSKFNDIASSASGDPFGGTYKFNPNQIKATLPTNQLLRPWDNVPKKALAQDVSGSRLIYGNYTESYNYPTDYLDISPIITNRPMALVQSEDGGPSVKTQRTYQVGVVFIDKEGRESPIITNSSASVTVPKSLLDTNTMLSVSNNSTIPEWVNSFKYYVKDIKPPTYNFVIDSFYKAENGDFWLSVPSSERNKLEEGDLIELKKGINSDASVGILMSSKVIAIENEAPDFIKTKLRSLGKAKHNYSDAAGASFVLIPVDGQPEVGKDWFHIVKDRWLDQNDEGFGGGGDLVQYKDTAIQFEASPTGTTAVGGTYRSKLYQASAISFGGTDYVIRLEEPIAASDDWIVSDPTATPAVIEPTLKVQIYEKTSATSAEYHGKFFAKIEAKEDLLDNIASKDVTKAWEEVIFKLPVRNFCDGEVSMADETTLTSTSGATLNETLYDYTNGWGWNQYPGNITGSGVGVAHRTDSFWQWFDFLDWNNTAVGAYYPNYWFIDRMYYLQKQLKTDIQANGQAVWNNHADGSGRGIFQATQQQGQDEVHLTAGKWYIELGYVGLHQDIGGGIGKASNNSHAFDIRWEGLVDGSFISLINPAWGTNPEGWRSEFSATNQQDALYNITFPFRKFKWEGDDEVYIITNAHQEWRWNHTSMEWADVEQLDEIASGQDPAGGWPVSTRVRDQFKHPSNRRLTWILEIDRDPTTGSVDMQNPTHANSEVAVEMVFLEQNFDSVKGQALRTTNPAVFEIKKQAEDSLDIYYEASDEIPINLNYQNLQRLIPVGSKVTYPGDKSLLSDSVVTQVTEGSPSKIIISGNDLAYNVSYPIWQDIIASGSKLRFTTPSGDTISIKLQYAQGLGTPNPIITPVNSTLGDNFTQGLSWYNCISFRNGVESFFLKDNYNEKFIAKGVKASSTLEKEYEETYKKSGLIYSGLFNSTSDVNNLNQFIQAEKITKETNPSYGSIQKLHSRDGDLVVFCEDKVLRILANKDALYNADGNPQLIATDRVLGQTIPFSGEFGISKNPESFASESYRAYFTDKVRGSVIRLSKDGLTAISDHGMKDWFKDNLRLSTKLVGSYDDKKDEYNITLENTTESIAKTVSFREDVRGWVSFKSFAPENGVSCANEYYTFKNGKLWQHHVESVNRNTFYNFPVANSSVTVLMNDMPSSVKSFSTVNYEGSQARVSLSLDANGTIVQDGDYFNLTPLEGWFVDSAFTNLEKGSVSNFIEKEGKWFGFINGDNITSNFFGITTENFDTSDFSIQGIGVLNSTPTVSSASGCTDATAFNYQSAATVDDGSCYAIIYGCMDTDADNFIPLVSDILVDVNTSNGSCLYYGCTVVGSFNFDPTANSNDGSCVAVVLGCTNPTQFGFNPLANTDNGSCTPFVYGCMDDTTLGGCGSGCDGALNYNPNANTNDGSCTYAVPGCMNFDAWNYNSNATYQPIVVGTCKMCGDATANNYDYPSTYPIPDNYSGCIYCPATTGFTATASATVATEIDLQWDLPLSNLNVVNGGNYTVSVTNVVDGTTVNTSITPGSSGPYLTHTITGLSAGTYYSITIQAECSNTVGPVSSTKYATTIHIIGCMDGDGTYNGNGSWPACNFNPLATSQTGGVVGYSASDCNYNCAGCTDPNYAEFCDTCYTSPVGDFGTVSVNGPYIYDDGSCVTLISYGCTDVQPDIIQNLIFYPYYTNFDNSAGVLACCTLCDGSDDNNCCIPTVLGCTDNSTINATNSTVIAATNYNPLANTDDGSCVYPCPTLTQSGTNFSNAYPPAPFSFNRITSFTNLSLTNYNASIPTSGGLGIPSAYTTTFKVTDNNSTVLYNNANQGGFTKQYHTAAAGGGFWRHKLQLDFSALNVTEGNHNSITCDMEITTNDGNCVVLKSNQYTIGCTDAAASNSGTFDFTDNTQCEYVGCTDSTLNNDGVTYFATNYNNQATVACTDINGGYSAASSPSQDNACCTYPNLPKSEFIISHAFNMYASAYSDYSSLNVMENTVTATAYTTAEIIQFNVAGALPGWQSNWIGGYATSALYTEAKWLDIPLSGSVDLTTIPNYSTTGIVNHSTIPSNFDNRDLTYSPAYSGNLDNALAHNGLTIDYKVKFTATIINQSRANQIVHTVHNIRTFTGGCKISTTGVYTAANSNLDPTWKMHIPGSCVLNPIPGCTTATAINYNPAATVDDGNCCLTCLAPTAFDVSNPTMVGGFATQVEVTFGDVCEATSYTLYVQALSVNSNTVTAIQTIIAPVGAGVTTIVPLYSGVGITYPANGELIFTIETTCSDGSTSPLATSSLVLPPN